MNARFNYDKKHIRHFSHSLRCKDCNNLTCEVESISMKIEASSGEADTAPPNLTLSRVNGYEHFTNSASSSKCSSKTSGAKVFKDAAEKRGAGVPRRMTAGYAQSIPFLKVSWPREAHANTRGTSDCRTIT